MREFTEQALILFPHLDCYSGKQDSYYNNMRKVILNLITYFKKEQITPLALMTDNVANEYKELGLTFVQTATDGDCLFIKRNLQGISTDIPNMVKLPELYKKAVMKYPPVREPRVELQALNVAKRVTQIENNYIKQQRAIVSIQTPNYQSYNIKPKANSAKLLVKVHNGNFIPTVFISDQEVGAISVFNFPNAHTPLHEWRLYNA